MTHTADIVVEQETTSASPDPISSKPRRRAVIAKIRKETGISQKKANAFLNWLQTTVTNLRTDGGATHYLTKEEMRAHHTVLDAIAPDDTSAKPDSAHDLTQRFVLDEARDEVALTHSRDRVFDEEYCSVTVSVLSIGT